MQDDSAFGTLSAQTFLRDYWQQKPLLIRQAFADFHSPLSPDELAGLACEEDVSSRIVIEHGATPWAVRYGPFDEKTFAELPPTHWTLLVSDVEKHLPQLRSNMEPFRFIPDWRIDDLMISYAPDGGSVGPHVDEYDVFLLQAQGQRRWAISTETVTADNFIEQSELRILKNFDAQEHWLLQPGDMLYLPPGVAHHGVAVGECMTFSIGFRAPALRDMLSGFTDYLIKAQYSQGRYKDVGLQRQDNPGQISAQALEQIRGLLQDVLKQGQTELTQWFGQFITEAANDNGAFLYDNSPLQSAAFADAFAQTGQLQRSSAARFAFSPQDNEILFFSDGQCHTLAPDLLSVAQALCRDFHYAYPDWADALQNTACLQLLTALYNDGMVYFDHD